MALKSGSHTLGHDRGTLWVRTRKAGAAAKAGHDLLIEVADWEATLDVGDDGAPTSIVLSANPRSLKVREGTGGITSLGDDDKASIEQTIDEDVLRGTAIRFRSTEVEVNAVGGRLRVSGDLELGGQSHPIAFDVTLGEDGRVTGRAALKQTDWGIKPYSGLFGTLKVVDEVAVEVAAELP
ncbi:MAG: YceI family protein [Solirubrobacterales bacterium]|nr:YceI family protein [Solirubrobacterales bacterium]